ncbi:type IV toxin-antitoxin system AbiEi family antitoxin domain-containing protein [Rhodohalobacter sp. 8-1]|uniref:type IV toxin-antitoxin system AbiEi family antitoxin domain-containing protein n=1 Tax=Rhodohalobacter sp. 8-1 TaxID=3131972 RepID=UPI0030EEB7D1
MYTSKEKIRKALSVFKDQEGLLRTSEALSTGIHPRTLYKLRDEGYITKLGRGLYKLADDPPLSNPDVAIVAARVPNAKICLLSALDFHEMTKEIPHKVHIAIARTQRDPKIDYPPIEVYRFTDESFTEGVEKHEIDGQTIQVYSPAKTIADCFKFRNKIGKDIAIEALQSGLEQKNVEVKEILRFAKICRVENIMKPYLEATING